MLLVCNIYNIIKENKYDNLNKIYVFILLFFLYKNYIKIDYINIWSFIL